MVVISSPSRGWGANHRYRCNPVERVTTVSIPTDRAWRAVGFWSQLVWVLNSYLCVGSYQVHTTEAPVKSRSRLQLPSHPPGGYRGWVVILLLLFEFLLDRLQLWFNQRHKRFSNNIHEEPRMNHHQAKLAKGVVTGR